MLIFLTSFLCLSSVSASVDSENITSDTENYILNENEINTNYLSSSQKDEDVLSADFNPTLTIEDSENSGTTVNLETGSKVTWNIKASGSNFNYYSGMKVTFYNDTNILESGIALSQYSYSTDDYRGTYTTTFYKAGTYIIHAVLPAYQSYSGYSYAEATSNEITYIVTGEDIDPSTLPQDYYLRIYEEDAPDNTTFVYDNIYIFHIYNMLFNNLGLSGSAVKSSLYQSGDGYYNPVTYYVNGVQTSDYYSGYGYRPSVWVNGTDEASSYSNYPNYFTWEPSTTGVYEIYAVYSATSSIGTLKSDTITLYVGVEPPASDKNTTLTLTTSNSQVKAGDSVVITHSVVDEDENSVGEGNVTYKYENGTIIDTLNLDESLTLPTLSAGNYTILATYNGVEGYKTSESSIAINITKYDVDVSISVTSPTYPTNATVTITANAVGTYTITINGKEFEITISEGQTTGSITIDRLAARDYSYTATVEFAENDKYKNASNQTTFYVLKCSIDITASANTTEITYGGSVFVKGTADVNGTINFYEGEKLLGSKNVNEELTLADLNATTHIITVEFVNENYTTATDTIDIIVKKADIELSISISEIVYPNNATGTVKANVAGVYTIKIGDRETTVDIDDSGVAVFDAGKFDVGDNYEATISIASSDNYNSALNSTHFNVVSEGITLTIGANQTGIDYGTPITLTHEITEGVTGSVKFFYINDTEIGEVTVSNDLSNIVLPAGEHQIYAKYISNNVNYKNTQSTPITVTVNFLKNNIKLTIDEVTYPDLVNVKLTADVDGDYNVYLNSSSDPVVVSVSGGSGNKTLKLASGSYKANVTWTDTNFEDSYDETTFNVLKATNTVTLTIDEVTLPDSVEIVVTASVDGTYTVKINENTIKVVVSGNSGSSTTILPAGKYTATLDWSNENYSDVSLTKSFEVFVEDISEIIKIRDNTYPSNSTIYYVEGSQILIEYYVARPSDTYVTENVVVYCNNKVVASFDALYETTTIGSWANIGRYISFNESGTYEFYATYETFGFGSESYDETSNVITYIVNIESEEYETELALTDYDDGKSGTIESDIKDINILITLSSADLGNVIGEYANGSEVYLYQNGHLLGNLTLNENGQALAIISPISAAGWYNFTVEFKGNGKGLKASKNATINYRLSSDPITKENYTTTLKAEDNSTGKYGNVNSTVGEDLVILITLSSADLGNVIGEYANGSLVYLYQNGHLLGNLTLNEEAQALAVIHPITSEGWYNFTVEFKGNDKGLKASENATINYYVSNKTSDVKLASSLEITLSKTSISIGETLTVSYTLTSGTTGTITFYEGSKQLGQVNVGDTFTIDNLTQGMHYIEARYSGDNKYNSSVSNIEIVDVKALKNNLNLTIADVYYPQKVEIILSADVDGEYSLTINGNSFNITVKGGSGLVEIQLPVGEYRAIVTYGGSDEYASNSVEKTFNVLIKNPNFTANVDKDTVKLGESITLTSSADTTGKVTYVFSNGTNITSSIGESIKITPDSIGSLKIIAIFEGSDEYESQSVELNITVLDGRSEVELNVSCPSEVTIGDSITLKVTLSGDATGNITYLIDNNPVTLTVGEDLIIAADEVSTKEIKITYNGDSKYLSKSTTVKVKINKKDAEIDVVVSPDNTTIGETVSVKVNISSDATGNITYIVNGRKTTLPVGETLVITSDTIGINNVSIRYDGDLNYNPISISKSFNIYEIKQSILINAPDIEKYFGDSQRFRVTITDLDAKAIANESVVIIVNGVPYDRTTNANGTATAPLGLGSGTYNITTICANQTVYSTVVIKSTVDGNDLVKIYRNASRYEASFIDAKGSKLANTTVSFNINGILYERKTNSEGVARMNINLGQGSYIITAINPQTDERHTNNITVLPNIIENNNLTKYYRNASQYMVKVIDGSGNPIARTNVTFNINGMIYTRTSNANGIARININLQPGDYIITAQYNGCSVSNSIKVLPVLSANNLTKKYGTSDQFLVNLVDGNGNALAGVNVTFNINGMMYTRHTNDNGIARLNINLMSGEYIITSSYNGSNTANKITVTD